MNSYVKIGMITAAGIIYVFSFFFILYSMSSFLQSRKKEFGLLMIQGMSMRQIRSMVFLENMVIGFFATVSGILLGLVFAKGILLLAENVLVIENLPFYIPIQAILLTFVSFIVLFFFISLFVSYVLRSKKLIELIKGDQKSKGEPKANLFLTILAVALLAIGYGVALFVEGLTVIVVMIPVIIVVMIGTYLLFTQLSVYVIRWLKNKESFFWHKTNLLLFSDLSFRMKDNARTFFMVAMVSTVAFCAIGSLFGFESFLTSTLKNTSPYSIAYQTYEKAEEQADVALINEILKENNIEAKTEQALLRYNRIGQEYFLIAKQSDFNRFANLLGEEPIKVRDGEIFVVEFEGTDFGQTDELLDLKLKLNSGETLEPEEVIFSRALPATDSYFVVSDQDYESLPAPDNEMSYHVWNVTDGKEAVFEASEKMYIELPSHKLQARDYEVFQINQYYGAVLFIGLFIGIVFFVAAGSFLYFRLYMDVDGDKQKFKSISKMGLTDKELKQVLTRQTMILFFAPIIVALIHGAVALTALSHMFYHNLLTESVTVLSVFFAIQVIYFFIVRFFYTKQIEAAIH